MILLSDAQFRKIPFKLLSAVLEYGWPFPVLMIDYKFKIHTHIHKTGLVQLNFTWSRLICDRRQTEVSNFKFSDPLMFQCSEIPLWEINHPCTPPTPSPPTPLQHLEATLFRARPFPHLILVPSTDLARQILPSPNPSPFSMTVSKQEITLCCLEQGFWLGCRLHCNVTKQKQLALGAGGRGGGWNMCFAGSSMTAGMISFLSQTGNKQFDNFSCVYQNQYKTQ